LGYFDASGSGHERSKGVGRGIWSVSRSAQTWEPST
jgi:hypothetical protein